MFSFCWSDDAALLNDIKCISGRKSLHTIKTKSFNQPRAASYLITHLNKHSLILYLMISSQLRDAKCRLKLFHFALLRKPLFLWLLSNNERIRQLKNHYPICYSHSLSHRQCDASINWLWWEEINIDSSFRDSGKKETNKQSVPLMGAQR